MPGWLTYQAVLPKMDKRIYTGRVQLLERKGISVISDIDDTIKVSEVTNPDSKIFLRNTFINEYQAVEDMANLYRQWENAGMQFHYVSANPWQLYDTINKFMESAGFPKGSMRLRNFRWKDFRSLEQLFSSLVTTIASYKNLFESLIRCLTENILEILVIFIIVFAVILFFSLLYSNLPEFVL